LPIEAEGAAVPVVLLVLEIAPLRHALQHPPPRVAPLDDGAVVDDLDVTAVHAAQVTGDAQRHRVGVFVAAALAAPALVMGV
jgi:hypothetical protein